MKFLILITILLIQACSASKPAVSKQTIPLIAKTDTRSVSGINGLSKIQKEQIKMLLSDIDAALNAYKNTDDSNEIAAKCDKVTVEIEKLAPAIPPGLFRNTLQQGRDTLNLAYLFRYEKTHALEISQELRKQVIDTYKISGIKEDERADRIFNFAQAHFEIVARIAADEGIEK